MFPCLGEKNSQSEGGQVDKSGRWAIIQLFQGYETSRVVSPLSRFPPTRYPVTKIIWGCGSPVVKVSDHGRHVISSSPVLLKTRRVGELCTLKRPPVGGVWLG
ncbi:hypothetical protein TNCV_4121731 [Trichonephila clavipes]|nr:hypothetical protein TNCV_4121731 [Trichonephila clavipes]